MATVSDAISDALSRLGVIDPGETPSAGALANGFSILNILTDAWGAERLTIPYVKRTTATITASKASYSVGSGGDINIIRPVFLETINYIDTSQDPDLELPLASWTDDVYAAQPLKALTSTLPIAAYYNPTYASGYHGTLIPWPIPTTTTLLWAIYHAVAVPEWSATSASLALPPGYHDFIVTNLAAKLGVIYGVPRETLQEIKEEARITKAVIKAANFRMSDLSIPAAGLFGNRRGSYLGFLVG